MTTAWGRSSPAGGGSRRTTPGVPLDTLRRRATYALTRRRKTSANSRPRNGQLDVAGMVEHQGGDVIIAFAWRRDPGSRGIMRLTRRDEGITKPTVTSRLIATTCRRDRSRRPAGPAGRRLPSRGGLPWLLVNHPAGRVVH